MNENQMLIQNVINQLVKMQKGLLGPQGCSVKHQQVNADKANVLSSAARLLKAYQELV